MSKSKITLKNIKRFIQGWYRWIVYKLSKTKTIPESLALLPAHKREQYEWRLKVMNQECLTKGACIVCGCDTPQLQMIDDACENDCYPKMMDEDEWRRFKDTKRITI